MPERYEPCVIGANRRCTRWSHDHPATLTDADRETPMCACGHTTGSHFAEPYCPCCAGDPCDLDLPAWLAARDARVAATARADAAAVIDVLLTVVSDQANPLNLSKAEIVSWARHEALRAATEDPS